MYKFYFYAKLTNNARVHEFYFAITLKILKFQLNKWYTYIFIYLHNHTLSIFLKKIKFIPTDLSFEKYNHMQTTYK